MTSPSAQERFGAWAATKSPLDTSAVAYAHSMKAFLAGHAAGAEDVREALEAVALLLDCQRHGTGYNGPYWDKADRAVTRALSPTSVASTKG